MLALFIVLISTYAVLSPLSGFLVPFAYSLVVQVKEAKNGDKRRRDDKQAELGWYGLT